MTKFESTCEQAEFLISADLDGELSLTESAQLVRHLADCGQCALRRENFNRIDNSIHALGFVEAPSQSVIASKSIRDQDSVVVTSWVWRLVPVGLAASMLILFSLMLMPAQNNPVNAQEVVSPFKEVMECNERTERDQLMMLKTLELELRSMRLELAQVEELGEQGVELENRLGSLIEQVKTIELSTELKTRE